MKTEVNIDKSRLRWGCRRGMLELDILLLPFVDNVFDSLTIEQQQVFDRLLAATDQQLFGWFLKREPTEDREFSDMIQLILAYAQQPNQA